MTEVTEVTELLVVAFGIEGTLPYPHAVAATVRVYLDTSALDTGILDIFCDSNL